MSNRNAHETRIGSTSTRALVYISQISGKNNNFILFKTTHSKDIINAIMSVKYYIWQPSFDAVGIKCLTEPESRVLPLVVSYCPLGSTSC